MTNCPHCGAALPAVVDAFCPECRRPLDDPPDPDAALRRRITHSGTNWAYLLVAFAAVLGASAVVPFLRGDVLSTFIRLMIAAVLFAIGLGLLPSRGRKNTGDDT